MDAGMLANAIMQALTPLLGGVGAAVATDIGNTIYDKSKEQARRLLEAIRHRFSKEQDEGSATLALQTFVNGDSDFAGVVRTKLERILQNDPDFSTEVLRIMRSGPLQSLIVGEEAKARDIDISNSAGAGTQHIQTGKKSEVERIKLNITPPDKL